jgi:DNA-binding MarR family transcriptional regulator
MKHRTSLGQNFALKLADAAHNVERRLDANLGAIRGISYAEYRLLRALGNSPQSRASRVDLAQQIGITPSGITRALRPLEKLGIVKTVKAERDARLAIATLTSAGEALLQDASGVVNDALDTMLSRTPAVTADIVMIADRLDELAQT